MSDILIEKSERGWIIELPDDFSQELGVEPESIGLLQVKNGKVEVEILPPPNKELSEASERIFNKYKDSFAEMKRLGD